MAAEPLVSIVMPAYNAAAYIGEAVDSVLAQTWTNWELLIVNDGSTDGTQAYLDSLHDPRIRVFRQDNHGVSAARNLALAAARGECITFLDADDVLPERSIERRLRKLLENPTLDIIGGIVTIHDETLTWEEGRKTPRFTGPLLARLLAWDQQVVAGICYLVRRDKIQGIHFAEDMTNLEDLLFWIEASHRHNLLYAATDDVVYGYRQSSRSASDNRVGWREGMVVLAQRVLSLKGLGLGDSLIFRAKVCLMLMKNALRTGDPRSALAAYQTLVA